MSVASGAFIQDRGNIMMQVAAFPAGYSNDGVFGYDDGTNKWIALELNGIVPCRNAGIYANGSDMTTKLNTILSSSNVKGVKFDIKGGGAITISGTVTVPSGKYLIFENGTYLTGIGTINGGIIDGPFRSKIFDTTLTIVPEALSLGKWSVRWFGALGDGIQDDQPAIQKTIDSAIVSKLKYVYLPFGNYKIGIGILVRQGLNQFCNSFRLEGETNVYDGTAGQTKLTTTNKNTFMVGLHKCKGVRVYGIFLNGANSAIANLSVYDVLENPATNFSGGCRDTPYSPHAGFVVDPFINDSSATDIYPDFASYYNSADGNGGSTDIIFDSCRVANLVVGYCLSPHITPQNGDAICINNCWGDSCRSAVSIGQSQNRSCQINNFKCWGHTETIFNSFDYGNGTGDHPEVDGLNVAGSVRYIAKLTSFANKGIIIKRGHLESFYMLNGSTVFGHMTLEGCRINFQAPVYGSPAIHNAYTIFKGGYLKVVDSMFFTYGAIYYTPLAVDCQSAYFDKCYFNQLPINYYLQGQLEFVNCSSAQSTLPFGSSDIITVSKPQELSENTPYLLLSDMIISYNRRNGSTPLGNTSSLIRKRKRNTNITNPTSTTRTPEEWYFFPLKSGTLSFSNIDAINLTADIVMSAGDDYNKVYIQDTIFLNGTTNILDEYGIANRYLCCGVVTAKNDATSTITLSYIGKGIDAVTNYNFYIGRIPNVYPFFVIGDAISGSNVITNCVGEAPISSAAPRMTIFSPYFPEGTHIISVTSTTITVSNNAIDNGLVEVTGVDWQGIEQGVFVASNANSIGYKKGDIIYNTDFIGNPTVYKWRITQSGITNSSRLPIATIENV
jgi:hypothetical protein